MQLMLKAPVAARPVAAAPRRSRMVIARSSGPHPTLKVRKQLPRRSFLSCVASGGFELAFWACRESFGKRLSPLQSLFLQDVDDINKKVKEAIKEAEDTCNGGDTAHCAAA